MSVTGQIKNFDSILSKLGSQQDKAKQVIKKTTADVKRRAPKWVAAEVSKEYGVKKADVASGKLGKLKIEGKDFRTLKLKYSGRLLTPTHFSMTPQAHKPGGGYTLKATIIKGQRQTLGKVKKLTKKQRAALSKNFTRTGSRNSDHSPIMLMHTGNRQAGGTDYIPFQRKSPNRKDVHAIKTVSLPQMISGDRARENIHNRINEGVQERLEHYMERYL